MKIDTINWQKILTPLDSKINKKDRGKVLIIAGSQKLAGAAVMACQAAFRAGAGLVTLAYPENLKEIYSVMVPEVMTIPCPATSDHTFAQAARDVLLPEVDKFTLVAIGPGLSKNPETQQFVRDIVPQIEKPLIIDADGLNAIAEDPNILNSRTSETIITPHEVEMGRLLKLGGFKKQWTDEWRKKVAIEQARSWNANVLLKGKGTVVANNKGDYYVNRTGGPELAKGGTGDVLTGVICGLWVNALKYPFVAACAASYLHGRAGEIAAEKLGKRSLLSTDIIKYLPQAINEQE